LPVARNDNRGLPKYVVQLPSGSYRVRIRPRKIDTTFQTLQEAKDYIQQYSQTQERDKNNTLILQPIVRNADGCPVINVVSKGNTYYALVDEDDYYKLIQRKWALDKSGYAVTGYDLMHRIVMNCNNLDGSVIDHINTNKLDNRKQNLRFTTDSFNIRNRAKRTNCSSKYTGVYWRKDRGKWGAYITIKGVRKSLGCYDSEEEAAKAYRDELAVIESQETANTDDALKAKLSMVE
jgi:hypothetical protein